MSTIQSLRSDLEQYRPAPGKDVMDQKKETIDHMRDTCGLLVRQLLIENPDWDDLPQYAEYLSTVEWAEGFVNAATEASHTESPSPH